MFWRWKIVFDFKKCFGEKYLFVFSFKKCFGDGKIYSLLISKNVLEMEMVRANHFTKSKKFFSRNTPPSNNSRYAGLEVKKILSTVTKQRPKK